MKNRERMVLKLFSDQRKASVAAAEKITFIIKKQNRLEKASIILMLSDQFTIERCWCVSGR